MALIVVGQWISSFSYYNQHIEFSVFSDDVLDSTFICLLWEIKLQYK